MNFTEDLLQWYSVNKRELPWRDIDDPYRIWLSEIMLQQTRIQQVYEYYYRFIKQWETVVALANASEEQVLKAWEGLGYYSRARNLHQTAQIITYKYNGIFPKKYQTLQQFPGIGAYTARAIASFAFNQPVVALDGNGFRVITRILDINLPVNVTKNQNIIQKLADELLGNYPSKDFNYALMDLGNLICKPQKPLCEKCPVQNHCLAFFHQTHLEKPIKLKTLKRTQDFLIFYWYEIDNHVAVIKKFFNYWKGLYIFPFEKLEFDHWKKYNENILLETKHILTHKDLFIKVILTNQQQTIEQFQSAEWLPKKELVNKPFPRPFQELIGIMV